MHGNSNTRKNTIKGVRVAFYARKSAVKRQRKRPTEKNVIDFLARRGYSETVLNSFTNQL